MVESEVLLLEGAHHGYNTVYYYIHGAHGVIGSQLHYISGGNWSLGVKIVITGGVIRFITSHYSKQCYASH